MKKLSRFLIIICISLLILLTPYQISASSFDFPDIESFNIRIIPKFRGKATQIDVEWISSSELDEAEFYVVIDERIEQPFSLKKDNSNCEIFEIHENDDGKWYYHVRFDIADSRVGQCRVDFTYRVHGSQKYTYDMYLVTDNSNVSDLRYSTKNIILVSVFITFGAILATYAIIAISEKSKTDTENLK